jgi:hypothetical protein
MVGGYASLAIVDDGLICRQKGWRRAALVKYYGKYSQRIFSAAQRSSQASVPYPGRLGPLSQMVGLLFGQISNPGLPDGRLPPL